MIEHLTFRIVKVPEAEGCGDRKMFLFLPMLKWYLEYMLSHVRIRFCF